MKVKSKLSILEVFISFIFMSLITICCLVPHNSQDLDKHTCNKNWKKKETTMNEIKVTHNNRI